MGQQAYLILRILLQELEQLRPLKKVDEELKKAKEKIDNFESYKEEWQSELSQTIGKSVAFPPFTKMCLVFV